MANITGTDGNDLIDRNFFTGDEDGAAEGLNGDDSILGGLGDDTIKGERGNDTIDGGDGDDEIYGIRGNNILIGGGGDDEIYSGRGTSDLLGGVGFDRLVAQLNKGADHLLTGGEDGDTFNMTGASTTSTSHVIITDFDSTEDVLQIDGVTIDFAADTMPEGYSLSTNEDGDAVLSFNDDETVTLQGNTIEDLSPALLLFGQVDGTDGDDQIGFRYADAQGETVTNGDDLVLAGAGDDTVQVYGGDDTVFGGEGRDTIYGIKGNNELHGEDGNDLIFSGRNSSELFGGDGDDELVAQLMKGGDHDMTGGSGSDVFNMTAASENATSTLMINDFTSGVDSLEIDGAAINFNDLPEGVSLGEDEDGNAVLSFSDDETVTLSGVAITDLLTDPLTETEPPTETDVLELDDGREIPILPPVETEEVTEIVEEQEQFAEVF